MSNNKKKSIESIEEITQAINNTMKKFKDLDLDKDLSIIISENTEPKEIETNIKEEINKSLSEKNSQSFYNSKFDIKENKVLKNFIDENNYFQKYPMTKNNNENLGLNKGVNYFTKNNNLNFNKINQDYDLIFNKMNNEKHTRNFSENLFDNKNILNKTNINNLYSINNQNNNLLVNSNFNSTVDKIYSSLEEFQKNIEKDFSEIEETIENLIEKDLKLLK